MYENMSEFVKLFPVYGNGRDTIHAIGELESNGSFSINTSSILTKLIQCAGRYTEMYASDLFIDWFTIEQGLRDGSLPADPYLFGFRETGVDGNSYIYSHCEGAVNYDMNPYYYRAIYRLNINIFGRNGITRIEMDLDRVSLPHSWDLKKFFGVLPK